MPIDDASPARSRDLTSKLVAAIELLTKFHTEKAEPEENAWVRAVSKKLGSDFPKDLRSPTCEDLNDPRLSGDPWMLLLLFRSTLASQWYISSYLPGDATKAWRAALAHLWVPREANPSDKTFLRNLLEELETTLLELARSFYRWPEAESPERFVLEHDRVLRRFCGLAKEIIGKRIFLTAGRGAARAFFAAYRLQEVAGMGGVGASFGSITNKIKVNNVLSGDKRDRDMFDDGENDERPFQRGRGGSRGSGRGARGGRGEGRGNSRGRARDTRKEPTIDE